MKVDITSLNRSLSRKIKALFLGVSVIALGFVGTLPSTLFASDFEPLISVQKLQSLPRIERVVIDARSSWKYLMGHIPGALNLSSWKEFTVRSNGVHGYLNQDKKFIVQKLRSLGIDHAKTIVVYGDLTDKWRTDGRFFWMFEYYGFKQVALLQGGFQRWQKAGHAIERGLGNDPQPSALKTSDIKFNREVMADQSWIVPRLGSKDIILIDNREKKEFEGATPYGSPRGGHIPGALHIDWREFFKKDGTLKPRETLGSLLNTRGIEARQEVVVYCTGGVRSAMAFFVFRHLGFKVRNYDGSWWDWSHNSKLPVEASIH